jgi:hypothetical protein
MQSFIIHHWPGGQYQLFNNMERVKRGLRFLFIVLLVVMASFGLAVTGNVNNRERYMDNEIKIEMTHNKEEDEDEEEAKE